MLSESNQRTIISKRYQFSRATAMGESDLAGSKYEDVIDLALGDPDIPTPQILIDLAFKDASSGHTKYTHFRGDPELRQELSKAYEEDYGAQVQDGEIFITTGACIGMWLSLEAILDDGDEVIIFSPFFTPYPQQIALARGIPVDMPTYGHDGYRIDFDLLRRRITSRTKVIVINSPNNPSGAIISDDDLENLAQLVEEHDLYLISDEIYTTMAYDKPFVPAIQKARLKDRLVTLNSFSKEYMMTGWRVGSIIAPEKLISIIQQINENVSFTVPSISQRAALYGLKMRNEIRPQIALEIHSRLQYMAERMKELPWMKLRHFPEGGMYLFADIEDTGLSSAAVTQIMLDQAHVSALPGDIFGLGGKDYIRLCAAVNQDKLRTCFDRLADIKF